MTLKHRTESRNAFADETSGTGDQKNGGKRESRDSGDSRKIW